MIHHHILEDADARSAIATGEFPERVRSSRANVAIILTQDWCHEWVDMKSWLESPQSSEAPEDAEIDVYSLEYNRASYGDEFMEFKESVLRNGLIPYVRYYRDGEYIDDSNYVGAASFMSHFGIKQ